MLFGADKVNLYLFYPTNRHKEQIMDVDIPRTANILSTLVVVVVSNYGFRIDPPSFAFRVIDRGVTAG